MRTVAALVALTVVACAGGLWILTAYTDLPLRSHGFLYYNIVSQLPVFALGIAYYVLVERGRFRWGVAATSIGLAVSVAVAFCLMLWRRDRFYSLVPLAAGVAFVFLVELFRKVDALNPAFVQGVGRASYSMYVIHFVFAWQVGNLINEPLEAYLGPTLTLLCVFPLYVLMSYWIARVLARYVEQPFIRLGRRLTAPPVPAVSVVSRRAEESPRPG